jgi:hypothetical protein
MKLQAPPQALFPLASPGVFPLPSQGVSHHLLQRCSRCVERHRSRTVSGTRLSAGLMHRGWFGVSIQPVLWSPVGAPAGVPGPRRNADDCDAGWFAPVATRRRFMFGALWVPSPWLAIFPGGRLPDHRWDGCPRLLSVAALVRGPLRGPGAAREQRSVRTPVSGGCLYVQAA